MILPAAAVLLIVCIAVDGQLQGLLPLPPVGCSSLLCALPECKPGETLVTPVGKCCPECVSACISTAVICPNLLCPAGQRTKVPAGECCPRCINSCDTKVCPIIGSSCKIYEPTGEAFCEPSCSIDNGGCPRDQSCSLQVVQCFRAPCPSVVQCTDASLCDTVQCPTGFRCEVVNNEDAFCQPDCGLDNGGCPAGEICKLKDVVCARAPCPPSRICDCPPACSKEFCADKQNRKKPCSNTRYRESPGCTGRCKFSYCKACYVGTNAVSSDTCTADSASCNFSSPSRCYSKWARCKKRAHKEEFGKVQFTAEGEINCYNPTCLVQG